jgi:hypothetical protein
MAFWQETAGLSGGAMKPFKKTMESDRRVIPL